MVRFAILALALAAPCVSAMRIEKRIAQVIDQSMKKWEKACLAAGGGERCNPLSVDSFETLLANAGPCDQQDQADKQIDMAKTLKNDPNMIKFTQLFVQQPRNSPNSVSIPYCQKAPRNSQLNGLFQCQFKGVDATTFVGGVQVGAPGTMPFGMNTPLNPPRSCPANPQGGVKDGTQLIDVTDDPGLRNVQGRSNSEKPKRSHPDSSRSRRSSSRAENSVDANPKGFFHQNGLDAQALNASFKKLTVDSPCKDGAVACIDQSFAKCANSKFVITPCGGTLICVALPLVNKAGTSITCDTEEDALARIAATGVDGGLTG